MPINLKPTSMIKARLGLEPNGRVQKYFTKRCADYMDKYVPFDEGNLADYRIEGTNIIYEQKYARYQYKGQREDGSHQINEANRNRDYHPLATSYWDRKMVSAEIPDLVKEVQDYARGHGGK